MKFNICSDLVHFWDYNISYDVMTLYGNLSLSGSYSRFYEKSDFVLSLSEHTRIYYKISKTLEIQFLALYCISCLYHKFHGYYM